MQKTRDGGYIFAGGSNSNDGNVSGNHGNQDCWIAKVDSQGNLNWQKSYGGSGFERVECIRTTIDSGYIACGENRSNNGDVFGHHGPALFDDYWIIKLDSIGNLVWQKCLGGSTSDVCFGIEQTTDSGYIVVGYSQSTNGDVTGNHGNYDCWLVKLDKTGNIQWQKSYGGSDFDVGYKVQQTTDGGYIICGSSFSTDGDVIGGYAGRTAWIIKIDNVGNIQWQKSYGSKSSLIVEDEFFDVRQTMDGGYILAGRCEINGVDITGTHGGVDAWIVKLDIAGNLVWQRPVGGTNDEYALSIFQATDGGYIAGCSSMSSDFDVSGNHGMQDLWIVKLSSSGSLEWQKSLGGSAIEAIGEIYATSDNGLIVTGFTSSNNDGDVGPNHGLNDTWLLKLGPAGTVPVTLSNFDALLNSKSVFCNWKTMQEINSNHFTIERSSDAINYIDIGRVIASGNSSTPIQYSFIDQSPFSTRNEYLYYRLKIVNNDGSFAYSNTVRVKLKYNPSLTIYPNPVSDQLLVSFNSLTSEKAVITISDQIGRRIFEQEILIRRGNNSFALSTSRLALGVYYLSLTGREKRSIRFIKTIH